MINIFKSKIQTKLFIFILVSTWLPIIIIWLAMTIAAVIYAFLVSLRVSTPIKSFVDSISKAELGVFDQTVKVNSNDEIGLLAKTLNSLINNQGLLLRQIWDSTSQMASASSEILSASEQQASGAAEQAASISQTTATMEELAATYRQIAENADSVVKVAERTMGSAESGQQAVINMKSSMEEIKKKTQDSANKILILGEKSQQIGNVLSIINDIADQTKILALNAAIEAARAGEAGKGFSVVAVEIRKLAESVVESTQEIRKVMTEIQSSTNALVMSTEEEIKKVEEGVGMAQITGDSLQEILGMIEKTTEASKQISVATQQQMSASDQVVNAMREVASVAEQTASSSKEVSRSVSDLEKLSEEQQKVLEEFTTNSK